MNMKDQLTMSENLVRAARLLKVLGHPARLQILHFVEEREETVTAIQKHLDLTQAMTSQHLKLLNAAGLVTRRRQGTSILYRLSERLGLSMLSSLRGCRELWGPPSVESPK